MTLVIAFFLAVCLAAAGVQLKRLADDRDKYRRLAGATDDAGLLTQVEIAAETGSELGKKLLAAAKEQKQLAEADWHHDTNADLPPEEHFNLFIEDLTAEADDESRLKVLRNWVDNGQRFTVHESVLITSYFQTPEGREKARDVFRSPPKEKSADGKTLWAIALGYQDEHRSTWTAVRSGYFVSEDEARGWARREGEKLCKEKKGSEASIVFCLKKI